MQSTIVSVLRQLAAEPATSESERVLYARWYCKRAIAQELAARARTADAEANSPAQAAAPTAHAVAAPSLAADTTQSWSDQVQAYLRRQRDGFPTGAAASALHAQ